MNFQVGSNVYVIGSITGSSNNPWLFLSALLTSDFKVRHFFNLRCP